MEILSGDKAIPSYSLQESTSGKTSAYYISQADGTTQIEKPFFLEPHRKDYYLFVLVRKGDSKHWVDMVPYTLKPDTFYFTVPQQVVSGRVYPACLSPQA